MHRLFILDTLYKPFASLYVPPASITGTVLTPAGEEATITNTPVNLASPDHIIIDTSSRRQNSTALTIAGHTYHPTQPDIAGTAMKAGDLAVTFSGTSIRVSGDLTIKESASTTSPPACSSLHCGHSQRFTADLVGSGFTIIPISEPAALLAPSKLTLDP